MQIPFAASDKCIARKQLTQYSGLCDDDEDDDDHYYDGDQSVYDHEYDDHTAGQQVLGIKQKRLCSKTAHELSSLSHDDDVVDYQDNA